MKETNKSQTPIQNDFQNIENDSQQIALNCIKALAVFVVDNTDESALAQTSRMLATIKEGGFLILPLTSQNQDCTQHLYMAVNMSLETVKYFSKHWHQVSFVWSLLNEDHSVSSQFWAKSNESQSMQLADYIIKEECVSPTGQCVTEGVFTVAGKEFGYQVECGILAGVNAKLGKNIRRIVEREQAIGNTFTEEQILDFAMNKVGQSPLLYRKAIIKTC